MYAVSVIKMIDRLDRADFREMIARLALVLRAEGLAAHRSADRLEGLSEYTDPVAPAEHARESILAKISDCYTEQPWHVAAAYLARLWAVSAAALDDRVQLRQQLRQQAAILLDAAVGARRRVCRRSRSMSQHFVGASNVSDNASGNTSGNTRGNAADPPPATLVTRHVV